MKNIKISIKLVASFVISISAMLILSTISKNAFASYVESVKWSTHTYQVINKFDRLMAAMVDMETGQRGYAITGKDSFLVPYDMGTDTFEQEYESLLSLTSDNEEQQKNLLKIKELKESWVNVAEESKALRKRVNAGKASYKELVKYEAAENGKQFMDDMRTLVSASKEMENNLLAEREVSQDKTYQTTLIYLTKGSVFAAIIILLGAISFTLRIIIGLRKVTKAAGAIAQGDFSFKLEQKSKDEIGQLTGAFISLEGTVKGLIDEVNTLSQNAIAGDLSTRGDVSIVEGEYKAILEGINKTLDETTKPIAEAVEVLNEIKKGNLTVEMQGEYQGDHEQIKTAVNETVEALFNVIGGIRDTSELVHSSANQVAETSRTIAVGTTEQACVMEEIAASIEEIAVQTSQNAQKADEAKNISSETSKLAELGNERMHEMMKSMEAIEVSSKQISSIIEIIKEIAAQTNMLSLNASIEAARAGEQGRGFAVVAEEVRELAERSAGATQESIQVIQESLKNVERGMEYAKIVNESLENILAESEKTANIVGTIAEFCMTQTNNVNDINKSIEQVSGVIQTNAALSEESTAESESMNEQVVSLNEKIGQYKLY